MPETTPPPVAPLPDPEHIRRTAKEILARPEFGQEEEPSQLLQELINTLTALLNDLGAWSREHPVVAWLVVIGLVAILCALLYHMWVTLRSEWRGLKAYGGQAPTTVWTALEGQAESWREALELARAALGRGELRQALWIGHRVLLGLLHDGGAIAFVGHKTNAAYLEECPLEHPWRGLLTDLTDRYEAVIYGQHGADVAEVAPLLDALEGLEKEVHRAS